MIQVENLSKMDALETGEIFGDDHTLFFGDRLVHGARIARNDDAVDASNPAAPSTSTARRRRTWES